MTELKSVQKMSRRELLNEIQLLTEAQLDADNENAQLRKLLQMAMNLKHRYWCDLQTYREIYGRLPEKE